MNHHNKELLFSITKKDLRVEWFSGTGAGGQYRNKHQNCVRIHHPDSWAIVTGQSHRERPSNIKEALHNLLNNPKFRFWHAQRSMEVLSGKSIDRIVDEMMNPENITVEVKDSQGRWVKSNI